MAMFDMTKKKPDDAVNPVAGLSPGVLAGMAKLQESQPGSRPPDPAAPKVFHSPVQPGLVQPTPAPSLARGAFDALATAADVGQAPLRGIADGVNRAAIGVRNFVAEGLGGQPVQAAPMNYHPSQGALDAVRADNTAPPVAPTLARKPVAAAPPPAAASVTPARPAAGATPPAAPVPAPVPAAPQPTLHPGDVNTFTGANGVTRAVPGMTTAPGGVGAVGGGPVAVASNPVVPASVDAPQVRVPTLNLPRSLSGDTSGAERERQALLSNLNSQEFRLRNGPASRGQRAMLQQINEQRYGLTSGRIAQQTDLEKSGAQMANAGAEEQARLAASTGEGNANRTQRAGEVNTNASLRRSEIDASANQARQVLTGADGNASLLRNDGSVTPITDAGGKPYQERTTGSVTDADRYQAYTRGASDIQQNALLKPEERAAALADLKKQTGYNPDGGADAAGGGDPLKDAQAAIATGRISKEDARQRLVKAGHSDLAEKL